MSYDGFISYSHAADDLLAPRLQSGLQRFAKPWWKRRALRVFRDESSLSANPHLWESITEALDTSGWFVLLLSPDAAESEWVNQEIAYWVEHKDPSRILPVVTAGEFGWADGDVAGDSVPEALRGVLASEPRWVDLRFAKGEEQLDLQDPRFADAIADVASAMRGVAKDELAGEEVRQHRRTVRTAWAAGAVVTMLALVAAFAGFVASRNAEEAERQAAIAARNAVEAEEQRSAAEQAAQLAKARELAASAIGAVDTDPELATLLALEAIRSAPSGELPIELVNALWTAGNQNRLLGTLESGEDSFVVLSPDGSLLVIIDQESVRAIDPDTGEVAWLHSEETGDRRTFGEFSVEGLLAFGVLDTDPDDGLPNRVLVLDGLSGDEVHRLEFPGCEEVEMPTWSADGSQLAVTSGQNGCPRVVEGSESESFWIEVFETGTWESRLVLTPSPFGAGPLARWDDTGTLHAMRPYEEILRFAPGSLDPLPSAGATGMGDVTPDGEQYFAFYALGTGGSDFAAYAFDASTGASTHVIYNGDTYVSLPDGLRTTEDGLVIVGTVSRYTHIYDGFSFEELARLDTGELWSSAYDPDRRLLYTTSSGPGVRVWNLGPTATGVAQTLDLGPYRWVNGNSFSPGESIVAMDTISFEIGWAVQAFDPTSGERVGEPIGGDVAAVGAVGDRFVLTHLGGPPERADGTFGAEVLLWDPETGATIDLLECSVVEFDPFGDRFCGAEGEPAYHWYVVPDGGEEIWAFGSSIPFDWEASGDVVVLDPTSGEVVERTTLETWDRFHPSINPRAISVATPNWVVGRNRGGAVAHDRWTGEVLWEEEGIDKLEVSTSRGHVLVQGQAGVILVVETDTWTEIIRFEVPGRSRGMTFSPDDSLLAVGTFDTVFVFDVASGVALQQVDLPGVSDFVWIDDETLIIGTNDGLFGTLSLSTDDFLQATKERLVRSFTEQECTLYGIEACPTLEELKADL